MAIQTYNDSPTVSNDGLIVNVTSGQLGNAVTRYIYIPYAAAGFKFSAMQYVITATTLTIETCNNASQTGVVVNGTATSTDGTGAALTCSTLNSAAGFVADTDLIGIRVKITADTTTASNVGLIRTVTAYTGATGAMTLDAAVGAITSGVTQFTLLDSDSPWGRLVSDPTGAQWRDNTLALSGAATITATGEGFINTPIIADRMRIKCLTTNATNALAFRLSRGR